MLDVAKTRIRRITPLQEILPKAGCAIYLGYIKRLGRKNVIDYGFQPAREARQKVVKALVRDIKSPMDAWVPAAALRDPNVRCSSRKGRLLSRWSPMPWAEVPFNEDHKSGSEEARVAVRVSEV